MRVKPFAIPLLERLGRRALARRGIASRTVRTPHGTLHVYDAPGTGTLPPVVLLHGIASSATPFGPVLARLRRDAGRVVAPDFPGHGFSEEPSARLTIDALTTSVVHALDELLDAPALLVGNSLGGALALHYALRRPEKVRGLLLVSPAGARASDEDWRALRATFHLRSRAEARAFIDRLYHHPPRLASLFAHELPAVMQRRAVRELVESASNDDLPTPDELGSLRVPILLLWGTSERILPPAILDYFTRHLPRHALIERPEGFGHCPHFEDPGAVARRIVEFARTL